MTLRFLTEVQCHIDIPAVGKNLKDHLYLCVPWRSNLDGGFNDFLSSPLPGKMIQFDKYFSNGLKPPTS